VNDEFDERDVRIAREAQGYYELQLYEETLERVQALLDRSVMVAPALVLKGECLRCMERYEEGIGVFEEILTHDPESVSAYVGLGWCHKRTGRLDKALEAMERLLAVRPAEGIGLYNLACYCSLEGDADRALDLLAKAIEEEEEFRQHARSEEDLDAIRGRPEFGRIVGGGTD
jgi:tetratricopeptide (TPR) repeat protein